LLIKAKIDGNYSGIFPLTSREKGKLCYLQCPLFSYNEKDNLIDLYLKELPQDLKKAELNTLVFIEYKGSFVDNVLPKNYFADGFLSVNDTINVRAMAKLENAFSIVTKDSTISLMYSFGSYSQGKLSIEYIPNIDPDYSSLGRVEENYSFEFIRGVRVKYVIDEYECL